MRKEQGKQCPKDTRRIQKCGRSVAQPTLSFLQVKAVITKQREVTVVEGAVLDQDELETDDVKWGS